MGGRENKWRASRLAARDGRHDGWESQRQPPASSACDPDECVHGGTRCRCRCCCPQEHSTWRAFALGWFGCGAAGPLRPPASPRLGPRGAQHRDRRTAPCAGVFVPLCAMRTRPAGHRPQWAVGSGQRAVRARASCFDFEHPARPRPTDQSQIHPWVALLNNDDAFLGVATGIKWRTASRTHGPRRPAAHAGAGATPKNCLSRYHHRNAGGPRALTRRATISAFCLRTPTLE